MAQTSATDATYVQPHPHTGTACPPAHTVYSGGAANRPVEANRLATRACASISRQAAVNLAASRRDVVSSVRAVDLKLSHLRRLAQRPHQSCSRALSRLPLYLPPILAPACALPPHSPSNANQAIGCTSPAGQRTPPQVATADLLGLLRRGRGRVRGPLEARQLVGVLLDENFHRHLHGFLERRLGLPVELLLD